MSAGFDEELKTTTGTLGFDCSKNQYPETFGRLRSGGSDQAEIVPRPA